MHWHNHGKHPPQTTPSLPHSHAPSPHHTLTSSHPPNLHYSTNNSLQQPHHSQQQDGAHSATHSPHTLIHTLTHTLTYTLVPKTLHYSSTISSKIASKRLIVKITTKYRRKKCQWTQKKHVYMWIMCITTPYTHTLTLLLSNININILKMFLLMQTVIHVVVVHQEYHSICQRIISTHQHSVKHLLSKYPITSDVHHYTTALLHNKIFLHVK